MCLKFAPVLFSVEFQAKKKKKKKVETLSDINVFSLSRGEMSSPAS